MTPEERKLKCVELCFEAQYMDAKQYQRMMHDSTKRPWVGLTDEEIDNINYTSAHMLAREVEAKLKEKNNGQ